MADPILLLAKSVGKTIKKEIIHLFLIILQANIDQKSNVLTAPEYQ